MKGQGRKHKRANGRPQRTSWVQRLNRTSWWEGAELAGATSPQLSLASGHSRAEGLLADPLIEGITVVVIPLLLNMNTIFILPIPVLPVVWLIIVPKPGKKKAR